MQDIITNEVLELIKCSIGVGIGLIFYRIMLALETIAGREQKCIKTSYWIKVHGKIIIILVAVVIGIILYNIYEKKQENYEGLHIWKGNAEGRMAQYGSRIRALERKQ